MVKLDLLFMGYKKLLLGKEISENYVAMVFKDTFKDTCKDTSKIKHFQRLGLFCIPSILGIIYYKYLLKCTYIMCVSMCIYNKKQGGYVMRENDLIGFVEADDLPNGCRDLVDVVGMDVVMDLVEYSGGGSLYFPSKRAICVNARNIVHR